MNEIPAPYAFYALINISFCMIGAVLSFCDRDIHDKYFDYFRYVLCAFTVSFIVTLGLSAISGLQPLLIGYVSVKHYAGIAGEVYFPFTPAYGLRDYFGFQVPRLGAGFRESGIGQAFFAAAIMTIPDLRTKRQFIVAILLGLGGIFSQSTIGIAVVVVALCVRILARKNLSPASRAFALVICGIILYFGVDASVNDDTIGFASKVETDSFIDRQSQTQLGIAQFWENPVGVGVYSESSYGINLLASSGSIGVFGIIMLVTYYIISCISAYNTPWKVSVVFPLFITALLSQPLLDAPLVYMFQLFLTYPDQATINKRGRAT